MSYDDYDPGEYAPCQICERISYPLVPCESSGYSRICDSCVQDHALDDCVSCKDRNAEEAERREYDRWERKGQ